MAHHGKETQQDKASIGRSLGSHPVQAPAVTLRAALRTTAGTQRFSSSKSSLRTAIPGGSTRGRQTRKEGQPYRGKSRSRCRGWRAKALNALHTPRLGAWGDNQPSDPSRIGRDKARASQCPLSHPICALPCGFLKSHCLLTGLSPVVSTESIMIINSSNG